MSIAKELERLEELHAKGTLSDEEFTHAKRRILASENTDGMICGMGENTWCMLMHLAQLLTYSVAGIVVPIAMWLISKDRSNVARHHGVCMLNWMISSLIYLSISGILSLVFIGLPVFIFFVCLSVIFPIVAAIKAHNNQIWRYPFSIEFLRAD